jgi:hypothetical protein
MMKRRIKITVLLAAALSIGLLLASCGFLVTEKNVGMITIRDFEIADFTAVEAGSAFDVEIEQSPTYSVQITASESILDNVVVEKTGESLRIGVREFGMIFGSRHYEARITMPELAELKLTGSTRATVTGFKSASDLKVEVSGASDLDLDAEAGIFSAVVSGSSELNVKVKSTTATIKLGGASDAKLDLVTGNFVYDLSGSSSGKGVIQATSTSLYLSGASDIEISGSGGDLNMTGSGSSRFSLLDYEIGNVKVNLSGASDGTLQTDGTISGSLSGGSVLRYGGNPILGANLDISGGSTFERIK